MFSFKQLEALYWIATLGGFAPAARKLHTTQPAISKRIKELETIFDTELFDRDLRQARLTQKGEEMLLVAKHLLKQRDIAVEQLNKPEVVTRHLRIGITELTAMTWLPRLVQLVRQYYPKVVIEPYVDLSTNLYNKLLAEEVDALIVPDAFAESPFFTLPLNKVKNMWMSKPGLLPTSHTLRLHELISHTILTQSSKSGTGIIYDRWLKSQLISPSNVINCSNLIALIGLTVAGVGVSYLPHQCLLPLIERGELEVVKITPTLPQVSYVALYREEHKNSLISSIMILAQKCCDFSKLCWGN